MSVAGDGVIGMDEFVKYYLECCSDVATSGGVVASSASEASRQHGDVNASEVVASGHAELEKCLFEKHLELKDAQMAIQKLEEHIASIGCAQQALNETAEENNRLMALVAADANAESAVK